MPKDKVQSFLQTASRIPVVGRLINKDVKVSGPAKPAVRRKGSKKAP